MRQLKELEKALEKGVRRTLDDVKEDLDIQLFEKFSPAVEAAVTAAIPTATAWGAHRNDGGLAWATYKATTRRQGVFQGAAGLRGMSIKDIIFRRTSANFLSSDFNAQLAEPIYKHLATAWEKLFQRRVNHILQSQYLSPCGGFARGHHRLRQMKVIC